MKKEPLLIREASHAYGPLKSYRRKKQEHFLLLTLDGANQLIKRRVITIGLANSSQVHPREVFAPAISDRACGIIVAHNHPSGNLEPSLEDKTVTSRLKAAGEILGIKVLDHMIISRKGFFSFLEMGLL